MNREALETALQLALAQLAKQAKADPDLVISEPDEQGRVQIEGTVDLCAMLAVIPGVAW